MNKSALLKVQNNINKSIIDFLEKAMDKGVFDAVLIPMEVPAGDSYAYVLIKDKSLLKDASYMPPVMPVQGGKAISSVTRLGSGNLKIAAIMRPCEVRATVELNKLGQTDLENITLISMDCPGVLPLYDYINEPDKYSKIFNEAIKEEDYKDMRPVCRICDKSSMVSGDLHIGTLGTKKDSYFIISNNEKGDNILEELGFSKNENIKSWQEKVKNISEEKKKNRKEAHNELKSKVGGLDNLLDAFSQCINCHNCMRVCPICYCRLCYFDSDKVKHSSDDYMQRAVSKGSLRCPSDSTLFQMGRMMHMTLSCVSCGMCEDACPMDIPVAQIFSMVSDQTQGLFDYVSGRDLKEPLPFVSYKEKELEEMEDAK